MQTDSSLSLSGNKRTFLTGVLNEIFGTNGWGYFWEARFLPRWLPLLLGLSLGLATAFLIARQQWHYAIPLALAIPVAILFNRYPFVGIFLWLLITPYFLNEPTAAGRFIYWIAHRATIPTALGVTILSGWLMPDHKKNIKLGRAELVMLIFLGVALVNIFLFSVNPKQSTIRLYDRVFIPFCAYWLIRLVAPEEKDLKRLLWVAFVTVIAQAAIGIISWFAPYVLPSKWLGLEGARTVGTLRNVAVYTSTILFASLILFQYAMTSRSPGRRRILLAVFGLGLYCIFMSFSRASWLGEVVVLLALLFVYPKTMLRFTIVLAILSFILSGTVLAGQVAWSYERLTGESAQRSAESRVTGNNASISMFKAKPFFGWGYDNYDRAKRPFLKRVGNIQVYQATSHNTYLTILAELGLAGLLPYLFPVGWWLLLTLRIWPRLPKNGFTGSRTMLLILWLVILHMAIVTNFMDMVRPHPFGTTIWWITLGFIANLVHTHLEPGDKSPPEGAVQLNGNLTPTYHLSGG